MARSVFQYEQPRCPDNWNEAERRFYNRLIETLDDIYSKYGRLDEKMLSKGVLNRIDNSTATSLEKMTADILSSGKIAADSIEATFAYLVSLSAKYGSFDFETVKNLVADAMVLEKGQADYVHITNLAATYAQAVNATIGNLVIQSSDGKYYQLDVSADGKVSASEVKPSDKEISAGETSEGKVIVGTHITAETLGTATLAATQALINMIDASRINVDTLVAREEFVQTLTANEAFVDSLVANTAFIKQLGTTTIVGDKSITMLAGEVDNLDRLSSIEVIEGTFVQTERREGEGIRIYSEIGPKQDLSKGDPYPLGGGRNLCPFDEFMTNASGGNTTADAKAPALTAGQSVMLYGETTDGIVLNGSNAQFIFKDDSGATVWAISPRVKGTAVTVPDNYGQATKMHFYTNSSLAGKTVRLMIEVGSATEWSPNTNICPIEGWTGLDAFAGGKNLCDAVLVQGTRSTNGVLSTGTWAVCVTHAELVPVVPGIKVYISTSIGAFTSAYRYYLYDKDKQLISTVGGIAYNAGVDIPSNAAFFAFQYAGTDYEKYIGAQVMVSTKWDDYAPYQGNTYILDFGETVYGGKVDWHAGEMVVDEVMREYDGSDDEAWGVQSSSTTGYRRFKIIPGDVKQNVDPSNTAYVLSNMYTAASPNATYLKRTGIAINQTEIIIYDGNRATLTVDEWKAWLSENPLQVSYKLAEPYTIQLTPVQIETLQGINTVYTDADGGRVEFGHSPIEDIQNAVDALEEAQAESALYLKLDAENKVVRIGQTEVTSEFDIDAYGAGVVVGGKSFSRLEGERVLIGGMEMRKPANIGGLAFDSIMT